MIKYLIAFGLLVFANAALSMTIEDLMSNEQLTVDYQLKVDERHIVGQPLILTVEVASDRWFAKGVRVQTFDAENIVLLASSSQVVNGSKVIKGKTWVTQTRDVVMYPVKPGDYLLPELAVEVAIDTESHGVVEGVVTIKPSAFKVFLPGGMTEADSYIVSTDFTVELTSDFDENKAYAVGDAITQLYTMKVRDTPAMMLPVINIPDMPGVSIYRKPATVSDQSSRGVLIGTRVEEFTFIFEASGRFQLEEMRFAWWSLDDHELKEVILPMQQWAVSGGVAAKKKVYSIADLRVPGHYLFYGLAVFIGLIIFYCLLRYRDSLIGFYVSVTGLERRQLIRQYRSAIKKHHYIQASQLLFQLHQLPKGDVDSLGALFSHCDRSQLALNTLYGLAFAGDEKRVAENVDELMQLVQAPKKNKKPNTQVAFSTPIKLNA